MVYILILVVGGITGEDAVHLLHDAVCIRPKLLCGLVGGQILIGEQRLTDVEIHEGTLSKEPTEALAGAEGHRDGDEGLVVLHSQLKGGGLEGANIGIEIPQRALCENVEPLSVADHTLQILGERHHRADVPFRNGHTAENAHEGREAAFKVGLPCGEIADMGANGLLYAQVIPHEYVIGHRNCAVLQSLTVFFEILSPVDAKAVGKVGQGEHNGMKKKRHQRPLDTEPGASGPILVIGCQFNGMLCLQHQHVSIGAIGICVGEIVTVVHE